MFTDGDSPGPIIYRSFEKRNPALLAQCIFFSFIPNNVIPLNKIGCEVGLATTRSPFDRCELWDPLGGAVFEAKCSTTDGTVTYFGYWMFLNVLIVNEHSQFFSSSNHDSNEREYFSGKYKAKQCKAIQNVDAILQQTSHVAVSFCFRRFSSFSALLLLLFFFSFGLLNQQ